jgi:NAD(P)-dependent dehydrogenase (short-subunit alcohol dehydrogenase family)
MATMGLATALAAPRRASAQGSPMKRALVAGATVLVTGSNQGVGRGFVEALLARGAKRVYASARRPATLAPIVALDPARVVPLELDVTNDAHRRAAAAKAADVTWLINNAGTPGSTTPADRHFLEAATLDDAKTVMDTNCWSQIELARLFIPIIVQNGGGALAQILSIGALFCLPEYATYTASKAAASIATMGLRIETDRQPILVARVFTGGVDTRAAPKGSTGGVPPIAHANEVLDAMAEGQVDIWPAGAAAMRDRVQQDPIGFERMTVARYYSNPITIRGD